MKIISKTFKLLTVFLLVIGVTGCSDDDDNNTPSAPNTVVDVALANGLTSLAAALEATNLASVLADAETVTVFAPDNAAFDVLLADTGIDLNNMSAAEQAIVTNILLNHVIIDKDIRASDLIAGVAGYEKTLAAGPNSTNLSIYFTAVSEVVLNGQSTVTQPDLVASNGVLHVVNTVIDIPTIGTFATTNPALGDLVTALATADTGSMPTVEWINTVLNKDAGPFTVFAPTNTAFDNLLVELGAAEGTEVSDLDPALVDAVLTNHVVAANVTATQFANLTDPIIMTLGGPITADNTEFTLTDSNGRVSSIVTTLVDIQAANGVVHVIDTVLLPEL